MNDSRKKSKAKELSEKRIREMTREEISKWIKPHISLRMASHFTIPEKQEDWFF